MTTATYLKTLEGYRGDARLYELDPPYQVGEDEEIELTTHVIVSAVDLDYGGFFMSGMRKSETMIFPATEAGILDFGELEMIPWKSHEDALKAFGYEISQAAIEE